MTARISEKRRQAFLDAVRATGNQSLAAERAKVSRSWVQLQRSTDAGFKRQIEEAVAEARERLRWTSDQVRGDAGGHDGGCNRPPGGWGYFDGAELVVKGTNGRRIQIARARMKQWTPRAETRFLGALAASCNVKAACAAVGLTPASAYAHRERWPPFARRWDDALDAAYAKLEFALLDTACNIFSSDEFPLDLPMQPMRFDEAMQLLQMHKHRIYGEGKPPGRLPARRREEEDLAELLRRFQIVGRAYGIEPPEEDTKETALAAGGG